MKCQNCNSELLEDAKFCTTCGTPVAAAPAGPVCPKCNAPMLPDARFCTTCGAAVEPAMQENPYSRWYWPWRLVFHTRSKSEGRLPEAASSPR